MKFYLQLLLIVLSIPGYGQKIDYLPTSTTKKIVHHSYFTLSYSEKEEQAEWVAYLLTKRMASGSLSRDNCKFTSDPLVKTGSASTDDYKNSGYDRGHLAPAADMRFNFTALNECFYMSNISPQLHSFNAGIWKTLESQVRNWALEKDSLYIVAAGVLTGNNTKIPNTNVTIPKYFYKIILHKSGKQLNAIAFLFPNNKATHTLSEYALTIDSIEKLTHIDFFPSLPDSTEKRIESKIDLKYWHINNTTIKQANPTQKQSSSPTKKDNVTQCKGLTKAGTRCKNMTKNPNGKCHLHGGN